MKGRSQPRSGAVYQDWARLLDLGQSAQFLTECPLDVFAGLVSARYALSLDLADALADTGPIAGPAAMLQGEYACYSPAWSKAARGQFIRGSLRISLDAEGELRAVYEERIASGSLKFIGRASPLPRMLSVMIEDIERGHALFLCFQPPLPPGTILTGLLAGSAYHDFETRPTASRMLCVRSLRAAGTTANDNRYIAPSDDALNEDLQNLGYELSANRDIGAMCRDFLSSHGSGDRLEVPMSESEALAMAFARLQMP